MIEEIADIPTPWISSSVRTSCLSAARDQYQPRRRSRSWLSSIAEHRRRLRNDFATSPSLRPYARDRLEECYQDGRRQALIEIGLAEDALPRAPAYTLKQVLHPEFLPD